MSYNTPPFRVDTNFFRWIDVFTLPSFSFFFQVNFFLSVPFLLFLFYFNLPCVSRQIYPRTWGEKSKKKKSKKKPMKDGHILRGSFSFQGIKSVNVLIFSSSFWAWSTRLTLGYWLGLHFITFRSIDLFRSLPFLLSFTIVWTFYCYSFLLLLFLPFSFRFFFYFHYQLRCLFFSPPFSSTLPSPILYEHSQSNGTSSEIRLPYSICCYVRVTAQLYFFFPSSSARRCEVAISQQHTTISSVIF